MTAIDPLARKVIDLYPAVFHAANLLSLGNRGGFSGASLWRVEAGGHSFCLRAWPSRQSDPARLNFLHGLMRSARIAGLSFVPSVIATTTGHGHVEQAGRLWDLTEWLSGKAAFHDHPSTARLEAACRALARIHDAWELLQKTEADICPAVRRRLAAAAEWRDLRQSGWQPRWTMAEVDPLRPIAERAWRLLDPRVAAVPGRLQRWVQRRWQLQPCHCDVWHDNLLFDGETLTGLIDYGAAKIDHPTVDVARLLGSLVPDEPAAREVGLRAYRDIRPFRDEEAELALALDETGTVIGAATWLRWLYEEGRPFADRSAVARRLDVLVTRMERQRSGPS
jgi:Ser/Thr protein kinase RdoA (MazF antagonist)